MKILYGRKKEKKKRRRIDEREDTRLKEKGSRRGRGRRKRDSKLENVSFA